MGIVQYAILGLAAGSTYTLLALGLIVIHRGAGVINFAQGAVGMTGTYFYWNMHDEHHVPFLLAFAGGLGIAAAIGIVTQLLIMHPLREQSTLTRTLATLGILISLTAAVALKYPSGTEFAQAFLPNGHVRAGSLLFPFDDLILTGIAVSLCVLLYALYRFTHFGISTSAVTEDRVRAAGVGINPDLIATVNWVIGSMLAAVAGILTAPTAGLSTEGLTLLIIPALAVAVVARFRSFPIALAAAFGIGIAQTEVERYVSSDSAGWVSALPFIVVIIVLALRGRSLPERGHASIRLPRVGTGRIRPVPVVLALAAAVIVIETAPVNWVEGILTTTLTAVIVLSVVVVTGYAGQLSLAPFALAGCGAWVSARFAATTGAPFLLALLVGLLAAVPIGLVVGLPAIRARGENLAIATLGMSVAVFALVFSDLSLTGGYQGTDVGNPTLFGWNLSTVLAPQHYAIFAAGCFAIVALAVANIRRGPAGRRMIAIRDDESAAASLGISVVGTKLGAFMLSSVIAALGGVLIAFQTPSVSFAGFNPLASINVVSYAVIGGLGYNASGPLIGSTLAPGAVGTNVINVFSSSVQEYLTLASGLILILILILNPDGVTRANITVIQHLSAAARRMLGGRHLTRRTGGRRWGPGRQRAHHAAAGRLTPASGAEVARLDLELRDVTVSFGKVTALAEASLSVPAGKIVGLIGPNGAGKSTLIEVMSGFLVPDSGFIELGGRALNKLSAERRARAGLGRTFQAAELFGDLTVRENLMASGEAGGAWQRIRDVLMPGRVGLTAGAMAAVSYFDLEQDLDSYPDELSYGRSRLVAIARAIAREPSVLLLDEPAAGLSESERGELAALLGELARQRGVGILLVEHDVELVMSTCDTVVALEFGRVIASGKPQDVRQNPDVIRAYLGEPPGHPDHDGQAGPAPVAESVQLP